MRPSEFSEESVIQAGHQLLSEDRNVTGFALRKLIGGGNPSRLKLIWDQYLAANTPDHQEPGTDLPYEVAESLKAITASLTDQLTTLTTKLNDTAVKASERRVTDILQTSAQLRESFEREMADANVTVNNLEEDLDKANEQVANWEKYYNDTMEDFSNQTIELAVTKEKLSSAQDIITQQGHDIETLKSELNTVNAHLKNRDEMIAVLNNQLDILPSLKDDLSTTQQQLSATQKALDKSEGVISSLNTQLSQSEARSEKLQQQVLDVVSTQSKTP